MSQQIRDIFKRFDELQATVNDPATKAIIDAIRIQTDLLNSRLADIAHSTAETARALGQQKR